MYDVIITGATVVDGTGRAPRRADIGILDGKIAAIDDLAHDVAHEMIDATGHIAMPGIIDINNHADVYGTLFARPAQASLLRQGVTAMIGGNSGASLAPIIAPHALESIAKWRDMALQANSGWPTVRELLHAVERARCVPHFGTLIGHTTLRRGIVGDASRALTDTEIAQLAHIVDGAMAQGAFGLSTALHYAHARSTSHEELVALLEVVARHDGVYVVYLPDESGGLYDVFTDALTLAKKVGVRLHIAHMKVIGKENSAMIDAILRDMEAENRGKARPYVTADAYPYRTMRAALYTLLPDDVTDGGRVAMLARLRDARLRARTVERMAARSDCVLHTARIAATPLRGALAARRLEDVAQDRGISVYDAAIDLLLATDGHATVFIDVMDDRVLHTILRAPYVTIASNGAGFSADDRRYGIAVHPRSFGAFARVLGRYVREEELLSLEEAVAKMTMLPAQILGISDRYGVLRVGAVADVVLFDAQNIAAHATFARPFRYATGVRDVLIGGEFVMRNGEVCVHTQQWHSTLLRHGKA